MTMGKKRNRQRVYDPSRDTTGAAAIVEPAPMLGFAGESFTLADRIGLMPLMRFAWIAKQGVDANDMDGLVAIYDLLRNVIADEDWARFQDHATDVRATGDDLMEVVGSAIEIIAARPTARSSDSSDGPKRTRATSTGGFSSEDVIRRLEKEGRPSIALMVRQRQEADLRGSA